MTALSSTTSPVSIARDYYNSEDADRFYTRIWGGEDIHIGLYETPNDSIREASLRTVKRIAALIKPLGPTVRLLDIGSGYGGAARYLAGTYGCSVVGLNLSEVENRRARDLNHERRLAERIEIVEGSFEAIPFSDASFDVVWSQDAILHGGERDRVFKQVARVLKPGGQLVFTDPMQADDCPEGVLQPILDRIHLASLGSPAFYRSVAKRVGLVEIGFEDLTPHLARHYRRVLEETNRQAPDVLGDVSEEYLARMKKGLGHWIDGGEKGFLAWGIFRFQKL